MFLGLGGGSAAVLAQIGDVSGNFLPDTMFWAAGRVQQQTSEQEWREAIAETLEERLSGPIAASEAQQAELLRRQDEVLELLRTIGAFDVAAQSIVESGGRAEALGRELFEAIGQLDDRFEQTKRQTEEALRRLEQELAAGSAQQQRLSDRTHRQLIVMTALLTDLRTAQQSGAHTADTEHPPHPVPAAPGPGGSPYPGLASFATADAPFFAGRSEQVGDLVGRIITAVKNPGRRVITLVGASGAGKSSLLRAGVVPALLATGSTGDPDTTWQCVVLTPGDRPLQRLVAETAALTSAEDAAEIRRSPELFGILTARVGRESGQLLIVVDQFEELFTLAPQEQREAFVTALANAGPAVVLIAVRADFYDRCTETAELSEYFRKPYQENLGPMTDSGLRDAIAAPAARAGRALDPALVEAIMLDLNQDNDGQRNSGSLPLLAHALHATWTLAAGGPLTVELYRRTGGVGGSVQADAERIYRSFDDRPHEQQRLADLLRRSFTVRGDRVTQRGVERPRPLGPALEQMIAARLMTADEEHVRIAHEALLSAWDRIADWVREEAGNQLLRTQLVDAAAAWAAESRNRSELYRGARLAAVRQWEHDGGALRSESGEDELAREFLTASLTAEREEQQAERRRTRRLRVLAAALAVALVVSVGAAGLAARAADRAREQTAVAESRRYAAQSAQVASYDPRQAMFLAALAWQQAPTSQARSALLSAQMLSHAGLLDGTATTRTAVALSPDSALVATGDSQGVVQLWDTTTHRPVRSFEGLDDRAVSLSFSPDGSLLAGQGNAQSLIWDAGTGELVRALPAFGGLVWDSPDTVITMSTDLGADNAVRVMRMTARTQDPPERLLELTDGHLVTGMAIDPDRSLLAIADEVGGVDVLDLHTDRVVTDLPGPTGARPSYTQVALDSDATLAVASVAAETIMLHDAITGSEIGEVPITGQDGPSAYSTLLFAPGDHELLVAENTDLWIWDTTLNQWLGRIPLGGTESQDTGTVYQMAISADTRLVAGVGDRASTLVHWHTRWLRPSSSGLSTLDVDPRTDSPTVSTMDGSLWSYDGSAARPTLIERGANRVTSVAHRSDSVLAAADAGGGITLFTADRQVLATASTGTGRTAGDVAFVGDGSLIAISVTPQLNENTEQADLFSAVQLRDARTLDLVATLPYPQIPTLTTEVSRDGSRLAALLSPSATDDPDQIRLYRAAELDDDAAPYLRIDLPVGAVRVRFSPDSATIAVGGNDGRIRIYDATSGRLLRTFGQHPSNVRDIAFTPDGDQLATITSQDSTIRIWDARTGALVADLTGHSEQINRIAIGADGTLYSAGLEGLVGVWNLDPDQALDTICADLSDPLAEQTWQELGTGEQSTPC